VWEAVLKLLEYQIEQAAETVARVDLTNESGHFCRGEMAALRAFRRALKDNRAAGQKAMGR
jgi:hypothetical protein